MKQTFQRTTVHLSLVLALLSSCEYKDLDDSLYPESWKRQSIALSWDYSCLDSIPKSFRVALYPADELTREKLTQPCLLYDVYNTNAVLSNLPGGYYKVTAWNTDTEHCIINDVSDRDKVNATTTTFYTSGANPSAVLDSLYYGQPIYDTPEYMVHANKEMFHVVDDMLNQPLMLTPDSMCVTVDYIIHGISPLHLAKQVRAAVNNVTHSRLIAYDRETRDTCVIMTDCLTNPNDSTIHGRFYLYGMEPEDFQKMDHTMTLFFWLDGRNIFFPIKINYYLRPYRREDNVIYLEIPDIGLNLRKYINTTGSFEINVDEWDDIQMDIPW